MNSREEGRGGIAALCGTCGTERKTLTLTGVTLGYSVIVVACCPVMKDNCYINTDPLTLKNIATKTPTKLCASLHIKTKQYPCSNDELVYNTGGMLEGNVEKEYTELN